MKANAVDGTIIGESMESNCSMIEKIPPKGVSFSAYTMLPALRMGTHSRLPRTTRRKVGTTSNHHAPYDLGYTRATMGTTKRRETARWEAPKVWRVRGVKS